MFTITEKIFIVKTYYFVKCDKKILKQMFESEFGRQPPKNIQIVRLINKFEVSGNVSGVVKRNMCVNSLNFSVVERYFAENQGSSLRLAASKLNLSYSTIQKMLKRLKYKPYKTNTVQLLSNTAKVKRLYFANTFDVSTLTNIWFTDESYFYLNPKASKNSFVWSKNKPLDNFVQRPSHSSKLLVWMAISSYGIFWRPIKGTMDTVSYIQLLKNEFIPYLKKRNLIDKCIFMQDGAPCHTSKEALLLLNKHFKDRVISTRYPEKFGVGTVWPPYSPDLTPLDFCLWALLKSRLAKHKPKSLDELQNSLKIEVSLLTQDFITKIILNMIPRIAALKKNNGGHFEIEL